MPAHFLCPPLTTSSCPATAARSSSCVPCSTITPSLDRRSRRSSLSSTACARYISTSARAWRGVSRTLHAALCLGVDVRRRLVEHAGHRQGRTPSPSRRTAAAGSPCARSSAPAPPQRSRAPREATRTSAVFSRKDSASAFFQQTQAAFCRICRRPSRCSPGYDP